MYEVFFMKRFIFVLILVLSASGLFAENIYYKEYKYGKIKVVQDGKDYTLTTEELDDNGFIIVCVLSFNEDYIEPGEVIFVTENQKLNGKYYAFFNKLCDDKELEETKSDYYFKNNNMYFQHEYIFID